MSLLELLHPDGRVETSLLMGSNCPAVLLPDPSTRSGKDLDLIILAPSAAEWSAKNWLPLTARLVCERLAPDGIGYMLAPTSWRYTMARRLRCEGLHIEPPFWHLPSWSSSQYILPYHQTPAEYAFASFAGAPAWKRSLAKNWFRLPGASRYLGYVWPSAGLVIRRPQARPLFQWLFDDGERSGCPGTALIQSSWRGRRGAAIVYRFANCEAQPSIVAKVVRENRPGANSLNEADILNRLGPAAQAAGARVPQVVPGPHSGPQRGLHRDRHSLLQTVVAGQPASELLQAQPGLLPPLMEKLVAWLERWHRVTVVSRPVHGEINRTILLPSALLAPLLAKVGANAGGAMPGYRAWLETAFAQVEDMHMPLVAAHNDLTMSNILIIPQGELGVIDWETGRENDLPLVDFYYALTDAVLIAERHSDRLEAFQACFTPGGSHNPLTNRLQARLAATVGVTPRLAAFCFHACWLQHAANEQLASHRSPSRPFSPIVEWIAANYLQFAEVNV